MTASCLAPLLMSLACATSHISRPNIVFIMADDLGWNDVSFHGSDQILTPNIDALAYNGLILNQHYSEALCTPSRAALLTGKYPIHTGMQHNVILEPEPRGLPLSEVTLPQRLQKLGYATHAVGKWHLGFYKKEYTPHYRGFNSHYGFWNGYQDYYKHTVQASFFSFEGYDMRLNNNVTWEGVGRYSTDLFTDRAIEVVANHDAKQPLFLYLAHLAPHAGNYENPLQAPRDTLDKLKHIPDLSRRTYAGMVTKLDESVGRVVKALEEKSILNNTIIVFVSDNGAATEGIHKNRGSNWPLKGEKSTPWEGGVRTVCCVWSSSLTNKNKVSKEIMHITDWLPTLFHAAGGKLEDLGEIDGVNQYETLFGRKVSARHEMLHNIDDVSGYSAIRVGDLKYVKGTTLYGYLDNWTGKIRQPKEIPIPMYNISAILSSEVSMAFKTTGQLLTSDKGIQVLREQARVMCKENKKETGKMYPKCSPLKKPCVFNIRKDPCEMRNLFEELKDTGVVKDLENRLQRLRRTMKPENNQRTDLRANPRLYNNTWVSWDDYDSPNSTLPQPRAL